MNPIYLVLDGWWWRLTGKKIVLWYTHKQVDLKLRIAEKLTNFIATATSESFQLKSEKVRVLGHGIDVRRFLRPVDWPKSNNIPKKVLCVGRITPIKHQDVLVEALDILTTRKMAEARAEFVGAPVYNEDINYEVATKKYSDACGLQDRVSFVGSVPNNKIPEYYWNTDIAVNILPLGGLDKVVFESLAAGVPTLCTNRAFESLALEGLVVCDLHPETVASSLARMLADPPVVDSERIAREYSSEKIVSKILALYE